MLASLHCRQKYSHNFVCNAVRVKCWDEPVWWRHGYSIWAIFTDVKNLIFIFMSVKIVQVLYTWFLIEGCTWHEEWCVAQADVLWTSAPLSLAGCPAWLHIYLNYTWFLPRAICDKSCRDARSSESMRSVWKLERRIGAACLGRLFGQIQVEWNQISESYF